MNLADLPFDTYSKIPCDAMDKKFIWTLDGLVDRESILFYFDEASLWKVSVCFQKEFMTIELCRVFGTLSYIFNIYINSCFVCETVTFSDTDTIKTFVKTVTRNKQLFIIIQHVKRLGYINYPNKFRLLKLYKSLLITGIHSDIVLKCQNKTFNVHSFVLAMRAPLFYQKVINENNIMNMSAKTLLCFLKYIYTGSIQFPSFDILINIYNIFQIYQLEFVFFQAITKDFMNINSTCDTYHYCRYIKTCITLCESKPWYKFISLGKIHLLLVFYIQTITCLNFYNQSTQVTLFIYYLSGSDDIYIEINRDQNFKIDVNHRTFSFYIEFPIFVIYISTKPHFENVNNECIDNNMFDKLQLHNDIIQLSDDLADVNIQFSNGTIKTFKALLAINSPIFESMFKYNFLESKTNKIIIHDFDVSTGKKFIHYIKCGEIEKNCIVDDIIMLYLFADKYIITDLIKKCSNLICFDFMSSNCAYEILIISDYCHDHLMKKTAINMIVAVPNVEKMNFLIANYPHLAEEVLSQTNK